MLSSYLHIYCCLFPKILKGERGVPKPEEMDRLITERLNLVWKKFLPRPRHTTEALYHTIMERLAEEVGCVPRVWNPRNWKVRLCVRVRVLHYVTVQGMVLLLCSRFALLIRS